MSSPEERHGLWFHLTVEGTREITRDDTEVGALVTVEARRDGRGAAAAGFAEVIIMDCSLSMGRHSKLEQAKRAVAAAIDALTDGTSFAVVAGNHTANEIYPGGGGLATATARTRTEAKIHVSARVAAGGTAMSTWITTADNLFRRDPGLVRHAVLYTDGINESEPPEHLDAALHACRDQFVCDVRGVGTDWNHGQLQRIADAMQGRVEAITDIRDLRADFAGLIQQAQQRVVPSVWLRLTLDSRFRLKSIAQTRPVDNDLTNRCAPQDGGIVDVPLLAWGEETRDYLVMLWVDPGSLPTEEEVRSAKVDIVSEQGPSADPAALTVRRLPYAGPGTVNPSVTWAMELAELKEALLAGIAAYEQRDKDEALLKLTKAVGLARRLGARSHLERLKKLVTIDEFGHVRLRDDITAEAFLFTATHAGDHEDVRPPERQGEPAEIRRVCPRGHVTVGPEVKFCEEEGCDHQFPG